jgi:hypothetical protein
MAFVGISIDLMSRTIGVWELVLLLSLYNVCIIRYKRINDYIDSSSSRRLT